MYIVVQQTLQPVWNFDVLCHPAVTVLTLFVLCHPAVTVLTLSEVARQTSSSWFVCDNVLCIRNCTIQMCFCTTFRMGCKARCPKNVTIITITVMIFIIQYYYLHCSVIFICESISFSNSLLFTDNKPRRCNQAYCGPVPNAGKFAGLRQERYPA